MVNQLSARVMVEACGCWVENNSGAASLVDIEFPMAHVRALS